MSSTGNFWQRHKAKIIGGVVFLAALGAMSLYWSPYAAATEHKAITANEYINSVKADVTDDIIANKMNDFVEKKMTEVYKSTKNGYTFGLGSWMSSFDKTKYEKEDGTLDMAKIDALPEDDPVWQALQPLGVEAKRIGHLPADERQAEVKTFFKTEIDAEFKNSDQYKAWNKSGADKEKILEDYNADKQSEATWSPVKHHAKNAGTAGVLGGLAALCAGSGGEADEKSPELTDEEKAEALRKQKEEEEALRKNQAAQKENKNKEETKFPGMIWFIVILLLLAGVGAAAYFLYSNEDEEDEELGEDV